MYSDAGDFWKHKKGRVHDEIFKTNLRPTQKRKEELLSEFRQLLCGKLYKHLTSEKNKELLAKADELFLKQFTKPFKAVLMGERRSHLLQIHMVP